jgi:hypothetical protein
MPKVRLLAPLEHDGKEFKTDDVISVDDDTTTAWRAAGKASLFDYEQQLVQAAAAGGHYGDVVGREETGQAQSGAVQPGPQSDEEPPPPARKRSRY